MTRPVQILFLPLLLSAAIAQASVEPRSVALSGALIGAATLNEGIYHNPASFSFSQRYSIGAISSVFPTTSDVHEPTWVVGGSIVDSHNARFSGGIGYTRTFRNHFTQSDYAVALATAVSSALSLGVTGKYLHRQRVDEEDRAFDVTLGSYFILSSGVQMGVVVENVFGVTEDFRRSVGVGSRIQIWDFLFFNADLLKEIAGNPLENVIFRSALELLHENGVMLQTGLSLSDRSEQKKFSMGGGWSEHKIGVFYAFQRTLDQMSQSLHTLSLRVFF